MGAMESPVVSQAPQMPNRMHLGTPLMHHRSRDPSSPESLNRSSNTRSSLGPSGARPNLNPIGTRPNINQIGARPNLSPSGSRSNLGPIGARPNLSPLAAGRRGAVNVPTPINMVDRLAPRTEDNSTGLIAIARRLSPRALTSRRQYPTEDTPNQRDLTAPPGNRRVSPTYADNRPQSLFPYGMTDASEFMNKLLASNPPQSNPSPALRRFRSFTPKLLIRSGFTKPPKEAQRRPTLTGSPLSNPPITRRKSTLFESIPNEILEIIFSQLLAPRDVIVCISTCKLWRFPAQNVLNRLIKLRPYAELPMLRTLRIGLLKAKVSVNSLSALHDTVWQLSIDYCQCNPFIYPKFSPKNPETMVNNLFWIFLFLDREFRSSSNRRRVSCQKFIKLVHLGIHEGIDKGTLKSLYQDIKSAPLIPAGDDNDSLQDENAIAPFLPHPRRRWWQIFQNRGLEDDVSFLSELSEEEDPFRPLN